MCALERDAALARLALVRRVARREWVTSATGVEIRSLKVAGTPVLSTAVCLFSILSHVVR